MVLVVRTQDCLHVFEGGQLVHGAVGLVAFVLVLIGGEGPEACADTFADVLGDLRGPQFVAELVLDLVLETAFITLLELPQDLPIPGGDLIELESLGCRCCHD